MKETINILKKADKDEVYFKFNGDEKKLVFDNIKQLTKYFLDKKMNGESIEYEVVTDDNSLDLYKTTMEKILESVLLDVELFEMYKNNSSDSNSIEENK